MFSGIIEAIGTVVGIKQNAAVWRLTIAVSEILNDVKQGDSIAVNGVCLTVVDFNQEQFAVEIVPETLRRTNFFKLSLDSEVNLERSITAMQRIGGHFVQGHVDAVCEILAMQAEGEAQLLKLSLPTVLQPYVVNKGFIALDGMSITVIDVGPDYFTITLIPHTQATTIAKHYQLGSLLNVEADMLGKYVVKFMEARDAN